MAVTELNAAVTAGNMDTPTQALIEAIEMEIGELRAAIENKADGVDTTAATTEITSAEATLTDIRMRFAALLPDPDDPPARSTGNFADVTITRDATTDPQNPVWKITIPGFNAVHELPDADLSATHSWNSITSDDTRTGGSPGDVYAIAAYVKSRMNDNDTPGNSADDFLEFDDDDRMGFGAWVNNGSIEVDNTAYVPALIDGAAAIVGDDPAPATGRVYLGAKTGTATYDDGRVAAIVESVNAGGHYPTGGTVDLSADFDADTLSGIIILGEGTRILLPNSSITSSHEVTGTNAMLDRGGATTTEDVYGANTGTWNARFVHEGRWIVGDFDLEPYGTDKTIEDSDNNRIYVRYKGAFGAFEE